MNIMCTPPADINARRNIRESTGSPAMRLARCSLAAMHSPLFCFPTRISVRNGRDGPTESTATASILLPRARHARAAGGALRSLSPSRTGLKLFAKLTAMNVHVYVRVCHWLGSAKLLFAKREKDRRARPEKPACARVAARVCERWREPSGEAKAGQHSLLVS